MIFFSLKYSYTSWLKVDEVLPPNIYFLHEALYIIMRFLNASFYTEQSW